MIMGGRGDEKGKDSENVFQDPGHDTESCNGYFPSCDFINHL